MPLRKGCSDSTISSNIRELMKAWEDSGEINGDKIQTRKEAVRRATAIALSKCPKKSEEEETL